MNKPIVSPTIFLDLDDVICLNVHYGGYDVLLPEVERPPDLWSRLLHAPAVTLLQDILKEYQPRIVLTTSWLRFIDRQAFEALFRKAGTPEIAAQLHDAWEAPQQRNDTRLAAIEKWLANEHQGEAFVVLDDHLSGTGLRESWVDKAGRLVLCDVGIGLQQAHLGCIRSALAARCN